VLKELKLISSIGSVVVVILVMMVMVVCGRGMLFLLMVVGHHAVGKHHSVSSHQPEYYEETLCHNRGKGSRLKIT
jgi:flagellar basal body-associated protein FliL